MQEVIHIIKHLTEGSMTSWAMCEYVLAKDSNNVFEIRQVNEPCGNGLVACTQSLSLVIPGFIVNLERNGVKVNGSTITLPANYTGKSNYVVYVNCYLSLLIIKSRLHDQFVFDKFHAINVLDRIN